jgi:hypothetical protein
MTRKFSVGASSEPQSGEPEGARAGRQRGSQRLVVDGVETVGNLAPEGGEEVAVTVERDGHRRVAHPFLDRLGMGALGDGQRHRRVTMVPAQIGAPYRDTGLLPGLR